MSAWLSGAAELLPLGASTCFCCGVATGFAGLDFAAVGFLLPGLGVGEETGGSTCRWEGMSPGMVACESSNPCWLSGQYCSPSQSPPVCCNGWSFPWLFAATDPCRLSFCFDGGVRRSTLEPAVADGRLRKFQAPEDPWTSQIDHMKCQLDNAS